MAAGTPSIAITALDLSREDDVLRAPWLDASYAKPQDFWVQLLAQVERTTGALKSRPGVAIDLYADAVLRHRPSGRAALVSRDARGTWSTLTYAALDSLASASAAAWLSRGVKAGDSVALVLDFGPELVVAFLAALRMGAVPSLLQVDGTLRLSRALEALSPAHVVVSAHDPAPLAAPWRAKLLPLSGASGAPVSPPPAHSPEQVALRLLSPLHAPLDKPVEVTAQRVFLYAIRDAVLTLRLSPGTTFAAPGAHLTQYQPALLLITLLAGATYLHVPIEAVERDPRALFERPAQVLLVTPRLRDALRAARPKPTELPQHWLKPVDEAFDWAAWRAFVVGLGLEKVMVTNVLVDAAAGGCVLFSARRPGSTTMRVLPAAGVAWKMSAVEAPDRVAAGDSGLYTPLEDDKPLWKGWFILARSGAEYLYGGTLEPRRAARIYPTQLVADAATEVRGARAACAVPVPAGSLSAQYVLCVFAGALPAAPAGAAVAKHVLARAGADVTADLVEVLPLYPHFKGEVVDEAWTRGQHLAGKLRVKSTHPVFQRLTALREALLAG